VAIGVGVRGFFEQTLEAWQKGVKTLTGPEPAGEVTARGPLLRPGPGVPSTVSIPGIWDVVKVGAPDPTDPATLANNRGIMKAIQNSPEPEYISGAGEIMTAIDNVRDVLALGMIAGRLTLFVAGAGEVLAAGGGIFLTQAGAAAAAAEAGSPLLAVGLGELTGLGAVGLAGEILLPPLALIAGAFLLAEMAHWAASAGIVGYAGLCHGPREAAFAAIPAIIWGRGLKANVTKLSRINPWSLAHEVREVRAGNVAGFVGREYIEAGRASAILNGHGWLLGAIVGTMTAGAFALQRLSNGDSVSIDTSRFTQSLEPVYYTGVALKTLPYDTLQAATQRVLGQSPIPGSNIALYAAQAAAECLWSLPGLMLQLDKMRPIDFAQVLAANLLSLDILQPYLYQKDWRGLAAQQKAAGVPTPPVWMPWTRQLLAEQSPAYLNAPTWPVPGAPARLNIEQLDSQYVELMDRKLQDFFTKYDGWHEAALCGSLLDSINQRLYWIITESDDGLRTTAVGPWKVLFSLCEENRQVLISYGPETVAAFFTAALDSMTRQHRNTLTGGELDQLAASVGMRLIHVVPAGS
jgi:hypothetical protein